MSAPTLVPALTKERFRSLSEGSQIRDAEGSEWTVERVELIERDSNFPGPLKAFVRRSDGAELMLLWDDQKDIVIGDDFQEIPAFNR